MPNERLAGRCQREADNAGVLRERAYPVRRASFITVDCRQPESISPVFPKRLPHGHDILCRDVALDVVDGGEDKAAAGSQILK